MEIKKEKFIISITYKKKTTQPIGYYYFKLKKNIYKNSFYISATTINIPGLKPNFSSLKSKKIIHMAVKNKKLIELLNNNSTNKIGIELLKKSILKTYKI
mgnify:CR=1 FL=1